MVPSGRLERPTFSLGRNCSIQLSYEGKLFNLLDFSIFLGYNQG